MALDPVTGSPTLGNLLVNGDFEEGTPIAFKDAVTPNNSTAIYLPGWDVVYNPYSTSDGGSVDVVNYAYWGKLRAFFFWKVMTRSYGPSVLSSGDAALSPLRARIM